MQDIFLAGSCCSMIINSSYYSIWNINPYIASYFNAIDDSTTSSTTALIQALWGSFLAIGSISAPFILKFMSDFKAFAMTLLTMVSCVFASSFFKKFYIFTCVLTISFGFCLGANIIYCFNYTWKHFPEVKNRITGSCYFFYTASPVIINLIETYIVNP